MLDAGTYQRAIKRNLYELAHARLERSALSSFDSYLGAKEVSHVGENFFTITMRALFNGMMGHAIKVLDRNSDSATFWAIFNTAPDKIKSLSSYSKDRIDVLSELSAKLKLVRDKTHFHIDGKAVLDPSAIWQEADIKGPELGNGLNCTWEILRELHRAEFGKEFHDPCERYDGKDVFQILDSACSAGILRYDGPVDPAWEASLGGQGGDAVG